MLDAFTGYDPVYNVQTLTRQRQIYFPAAARERLTRSMSRVNHRFIRLRRGVQTFRHPIPVRHVTPPWSDEYLFGPALVSFQNSS
jgi:hypothetical protein